MGHLYHGKLLNNQRVRLLEGKWYHWYPKYNIYIYIYTGWWCNNHLEK